jgi:hypothetical protein
MCGLKWSVVERMKINKLRRFGHKERMNEESLTKIIYKAERVGDRRHERPHIGCRGACMKATIRVEEAKNVCKERVR